MPTTEYRTQSHESHGVDRREHLGWAAIFFGWAVITHSFPWAGRAGNGARCHRPVGLIDIYPTLIDVCNLSPKDGLDGLSLAPLLQNPRAKWARPALTQFQPGQCAVRTENLRYIRYRDGTEELYDHRTDPHEWTNLSGDPQREMQKQELSKWLPKRFAEGAPTKQAYQFDPETYSWTEKAHGIRTEGNTSQP